MILQYNFNLFLHYHFNHGLFNLYAEPEDKFDWAKYLREGEEIDIGPYPDTPVSKSLPISPNEHQWSQYLHIQFNRQTVLLRIENKLHCVAGVVWRGKRGWWQSTANKQGGLWNPAGQNPPGGSGQYQQGCSSHMDWYEPIKIIMERCL